MLSNLFEKNDIISQPISIETTLLSLIAQIRLSRNLGYESLFQTKIRLT
jgi:hypothetical protein